LPGIYLIDEGNLVAESQSQQFNNWPDSQEYEVNNAPDVSLLGRALSDRVSEIARRDNFCLTIGGDHSITCGTVTGQATVRKNLAVIWVDAHPDLNSPQTSPSGNIHGMCASLLVQQPRPIQIPGFEWCQPVISPLKLVYIGLREVDHGERATIDQLKIKAFSMTDVDRLGIARVMEEALDHVDPRGNSEFHLSFDIDAFDPYYAPSTGTAVDGGLSLREGLYVCEAVSQTNRLVSMDLVEINPNIGTVEDVSRTVETAVQVICSTLVGDRASIHSRFSIPNVKLEDCASASLS
jgi:arginase